MPGRQGGHQTFSGQDRNRLINAFLEDRDWIELAVVLQIKKSTACGIIAVYERTERRQSLPKGGAKNVKITEEMKEALILMIEQKPTISLVEICDKIS